jgi:hypothetical protein
MIGTVAKKVSEQDLKFPDWSGMKPHLVRMSPAEAFRWNDEMLALLSAPYQPARHPKNRCGVEFTL